MVDGDGDKELVELLEESLLASEIRVGESGEDDHENRAEVGDDQLECSVVLEGEQHYCYH